MYNILLIVQILVALGIIGLVLVQHGKGADAGAAFGGGASGSVFGARGAGNFLSRTTAILALIFFLNSMGLAWLLSHQGDTAGSSIVDSLVPATTAPTVDDIMPGDVPEVPDAAQPVIERGDMSETDVPSAEPGDVPEADVSASAEGAGSEESVPAATPATDDAVEDAPTAGDENSKKPKE